MDLINYARGMLESEDLPMAAGRGGTMQTGMVPGMVQDMPQAPQGDLGAADYAVDILTSIPKGIIGAARDVASLPYLPMQLGLGLPEIPDYFGLVDPPTTTAGSIVETISGFATGYGAVARGLGLVGRGTTLGIRTVQAARAANVAAVQRFGATGGRLAEAGTEFLRTSAISGITSGLVFDGNESRLSNLLREDLGFTDPITAYLAASDEDSEIEGRLKNVIEDFLLGGVVEIGLQAVRATARAGVNQMRVHRAGVKAKLAGQDPDAAMDKEIYRISEEQEVSISRAMDTTLEESRRVLKMIDATGAARENFEFMSRTETLEYLESRREQLAAQGLSPEGIIEDGKRGFATLNSAGKVIIGAFKGSDLSTAIHEAAHGVRMLVVDPTVANRVLSAQDIAAIAEAAGAVRGADGAIAWTPDAEEAFVDLFTRYMMDGVAGSRRTRATFSKLTGWIREMYVNNKLDIDASLDPNVRTAFDNLVNNGVEGAINRAGRIAPTEEILFQGRRRFDAKAALPTRGKAAQLRKMNLLTDEEWASIKSPAALNQLIENYTALDRDITPLFKALSEAGAPGQGGYIENDMLLRPRIGDTRTELAAMFSGATSAQNKVANHTILGIGMTADFIDRIKTGNFADISAQEMEQIVKAVGKRHGIRGMSAGYAKTASRIANDLLGRMRQMAKADPSKPVDDIINEVDTSGLYMNLRGAGMAPGAGKTPGYAEGAAGRLDRPALDTYMVRILPDEMFPGLTGSKLLDAKKKWIAKAPNYASMVAIVRKLATTMDILPGENQERIWTSIFGVIGLKRMGVPAENVLKNMDAKDILASWDLLEIVTQPKVTNELKRLGFDEGSIADIAGIAADVRKAARPFLEGGPGVSDPAAFARAAGRISGGGGVSVITARRARGALIKAELSDFSSPEGIKGILKRDDWAVLTAENPNNQTLSAADNAARNAQLEQDLIREGLEYIKITGKYGKALENSFIVVGVDPNRAMRLGRAYGQEAVLTREGMNYRDGTVNPAKKVKILGNKVPDYYSEVNGTKFALDIDWGQKVQSQLITPPPTSVDPVLLRQTKQAADFGGPERLLFQGPRQFQMTPGSPGLGTPAGRGGEPRTSINWARFSTDQGGNEYAKELLEEAIERSYADQALSIEQQIARAEPAKRDLLEAIGVEDFGNLEQFMQMSGKAGAVQDAGQRIMASRQLLADVGFRVANLAKRHKEAGHAEMYEFLQGQQAMKFLTHYVKQEVREVARVLGAQKAVFVPDPDFKLLPNLTPSQAPAQAVPTPPAQAAPGAPSTMPVEAPTVPQVPSGAAAPTPGPSGAPGPVMGATSPATAPVEAAQVGLDPAVIAKTQAQVITNAGGESAVRAMMHRTAMAQATGNPLAVAKINRAERFGNMLVEYFMNSILSGPATIAVNFLGNSLVAGYLPIERAMGAAIRGVIGGAGVSSSLSMAVDHLKPYRHLFRISMDSWSLATAAFKADKNILENVGTVERQSRAISARGFGMAEGTLAAMAVDWLGTVLNIPTRVLGASDELFKQLNYRAALLTELEAEGLVRFKGDGIQAAAWAKETADKMFEGGQVYSESVVLKKAMVEADNAVAAGSIKPDERSAYIARFMADTNNWDPELGVLSSRALDYSRYATFTTPLTVGEGGRISRASARIQQLAEESSAIRFIMPFIRTPTRILEFALDRTIPGQAYNLKKAFGNLKGQLAHPEKAMRDEAMGRVAFAVMSTYGLFHLIATGNITGDGPSNPTERDAWLQAGNQPYSIRVGDGWLSYRRLDPFASMMGLVVDTLDSYGRASERQRPQLESVMHSIVIGIANNFTNKSYLTGVTAMLEAIKDPERYGSKLIEQYVSATVPYSSAMRQLKSNLDEDLVVRDVRGMLDAIMNTVPVAARAVEPKRNMFGEPISRAEGLGPDWLSPISYTAVKDDLVMNELNMIGHSFNAPREVRNGMDLTEMVGARGQTAYDRWLELHGSVKVGGQTLRQAMTKTIKSRQYQMMSPETTDMYESPRVRALRTIVEKYRAAAYKQLMREFPEVDQGVNRDFATKRALKTGRPVQELMSLANR